MAINQQVPPEAFETLKKNPDALYLDVRTEGEFAAGHPAGAINIPVMVAKGPGQMQLNLDFVEVAVFIRAARRCGDQACQACRGDARSAYPSSFAHRKVPSPDVDGWRRNATER